MKTDREFPFWAWHQKSDLREYFIYRFDNRDGWNNIIANLTFKFRVPGHNIKTTGYKIPYKNKYSESTVKGMKEIKSLPVEVKRQFLSLIFSDRI